MNLVKQRASTLWIYVCKAWRLLRELSGDDAYERYVRHHALHHPNEPLLTRQAFFKQAEHKKWHGVKRCC